MAAAATVAMPLSFCARRKNSRILPPLFIPSQKDIEFPSDYDDVVEEGKTLFNKFILDRLEQENFEGTPVQSAISNDLHMDPMWAKAGRELRIMADEFARSRRRLEVRQRAHEISLDYLTYEQFKDLLSELFSQGHITKERIMVLFYFCSDVAVRCASSSFEMCQRFINWSLSFITQCVCRWVRENGGWEDVLVIDRMPSIPKPVIAIGAFCFVMYFAAKYYKS